MRRAVLGSTIGLALAMAAVVAGPGASVHAEEIGDLYAAVPTGVLELYVGSASVVNTVPLAPAPKLLAFSPDGHELYAVTGSRHVVRIDVESITTGDPIALPAAATSLAYPKGDELAIALPGSRTIGLLAEGDNVVTQSGPLPGAVDLIAADRRDDRVLAAESGKSWIAVLDPGSGSTKTATIGGAVAAVAVDRRTGGGLVATTSPNRLWRINLATLAVDWHTDLPGVPSAIAALASRAVVAGGRNLWSVSASGATVWHSASESVSSISASDEGTVVYAAETNQVEAFVDGAVVGGGGEGEAGGGAVGGGAGAQATRRIALPGGAGPLALAPMPRASSIAGDGSGSSGGATEAKSVGPQSFTPPNTSTVLDDAARWLGTAPLVPGAVVFAGLILVLGLMALRLHERRAAP